MTIKEALQRAKKELRAVPVEEPEASAEFLMRQVLGWDRAKLYANLDKHLSAAANRCYREYVERKKKHEPVWQIVGKVEFWGMDFFVDENVLIPRPETEFLVEQVIRQITNNKSQITNKFETRNSKLEILDIGTGAGPIAIALAKELSQQLKASSQWQFYASDVSEKALKIAQKNAKANDVADKIKFIQADLFKPIANSKWPVAKFDVVTANLPYIPHEDLPGLSVEIHHYEPRISLDGGPGGLVIYEKFLKELPNHLNPNGMVFCEIGKDQGSRFKALVKKYLPRESCEIKKDLAGFDRIAIIKTNDKGLTSK